MTDRSLSVALVSREYPPFFGGGIGTYARWIAPALDNAGVRVHVVTEAHDNTHPRIELHANITVHRVPLAAGRAGWTSGAARFAINAARTITRLSASGTIHAAEFAECEAAATASLMMRAAGTRTPTIVQFHTPSEMLFVLRSFSTHTLDRAVATYFLAERAAIRLADAHLAPSAFIADWAHAQYDLPGSPVVIPYATGPLPPPPPFQTDTDHMVVLYVGRIETRKGVESLAHAWGNVLARHPRARLHLAGADTASAPDGGSLRAYLNELIDPDSRHTVRFLGRLGTEALRTEYARAAICVIPSLWENFPNTCIESMSHARPVLVSDAGGMREMIGHTEAGATFRAGDHEDLARQLTALLDEGPHDLARRGETARTRIATLCNPERIACLRIAHFREVIAASARTPDPARKMLDEWTRLEQTLANPTPRINLPALDPAVARWVEQEQAAVCDA